jgi:acetyl esterase
MSELRPEIRDFLTARAALGIPGPGDAPVATLRALSLPDIAVTGPAEPVASIENIFIPGPTAYIPVRIIRPSLQSSPPVSLPAMVYFHGGGWVLSSVDHYESALHSLANKTQSVVIAPNYQKAPEHKFPIPFDDCYATLQWVVAHADELGIDATKIGVAGDSAGGNLAAAVALKNRDENFHSLAYQLLIYPCCEDQFESESGRKYAEGYGLTKRGMEYFVREYVDESNRKNPYAFPIHAPSLKGVAPAALVIAEFDVLRDDGLAYGKKLESDGVRVLTEKFDDANHGSFMYSGFSQLTNQIHLAIAQVVSELLETH